MKFLTQKIVNRILATVGLFVYRLFRIILYVKKEKKKKKKKRRINYNKIYDRKWLKVS